jgi:hypothetical protein
MARSQRRSFPKGLHRRLSNESDDLTTVTEAMIAGDAMNSKVLIFSKNN